MADIKINDLTAYTDPVSTDVLPIVDIGSDITKKVRIADLLENAGIGSVTAPSFSFDGDNNTGVYRPGADQVALSAGGTQALLAESTGITIPGNLTVSGTTTTVDTVNLTVKDKNIELGVVSTPSNTTADGGGITLKGATDKTINWVNSTGAWTLSEHINIANAKEYRINGTKVLDATSLGSAVVSSSLTSVGTIATGVWTGTALTSAYIGADAIDGTKIADNSINSEHYVDGSIDTAHIADSQITSAKILDGTIVNADINASAAITGSKITTGTTSAVGVLQLTDSTSSTSATTAATPNSVKTSFDLAGAALPKSGGTLTGDLTIPDKIIHSGDTNTFIRFPAADTFSVDTAGSERLRIDSSGNLGLGTSSFTATSSGRQILEINGTASALINLDVGGTRKAYHFTDGTSVYSYNTANGSYIFGTNDTERMRLDSNGNLGIGTSSFNRRLDVRIDDQPAARLGGNTYAIEIGQLSASSSPGFDAIGGASMLFRMAGTERMRLDSSGNVGIGTSSPEYLFDARGSINVSGSILRRGADNATFSIFNRAAQPLILGTNDTERMRIDSSGNVGIGTSSPDFGLHLHSSSAYLKISNSGTGEGDHDGLIVGIDGTGNCDIWNYENKIIRFATNNTERMRILANGNFTNMTGIYNDTTGSAANVNVNSSGSLMRSTSSIKYKKDVETLQDSYADALLNCRPVWYRSTSTNDNPAHGWWGFIAEEVAEIDPRLVQWKTTEPVFQADGCVEHTPCDPEPEGVQYDRFVPHLLNLIKRQQAAIETLETKVAALEAG